MYFESRLSLLYVFLCLFCLSLISSVSCIGPSLTLVDPNNLSIPRLSDFVSCKIDTQICQDYKCSSGTCQQRSCRQCTGARPITFTCKDGYNNIVPICIDEDYKVTFTVAIFKTINNPEYEMIGIASTSIPKVSNQMIVLHTAISSKRVQDIIANIPEGVVIEDYKVYDIEIGFFKETDQDQEPLNAMDTFMQKLKIDTQHTLLHNPGIWSIDHTAGVLVNTSNIQITPTTFAIQRCQDGTAVLSSDTCPSIDPALVPINTVTSTSTTIHFLTIILPIIGGVIALIIAAIVIVRRRRANKAELQTVRHTEPAVEVTMA